ncbi:PREDICTED: protein D3-like [Diuraphis noxia]|uniref:protein D3-like n=1 Tax=Diuraphis noxia TaxID=143948 RepID=UPI0007635AD0|nr:PREDICTED: protein D3-like [Diuraphis noxia]
MMWYLTLCLVMLNVTACKYNVKQAMENKLIVPDIIPIAPKEMLLVYYPSSMKAELGNELTPTQVKDEPSVRWNAESNSFYTLCLTDPDAGPKLKEFHHWLVGNIPGSDVSMGETLTAYVGSATPPKTGLHRYVFLVYKQPSKLVFNEQHISNRTAENRFKFSIHTFSKKYKLGTPVAGNFYLAQYDDYVPILLHQLGVQ